jgi:hypothetical protein
MHLICFFTFVLIFPGFLFFGLGRFPLFLRFFLILNFCSDFVQILNLFFWFLIFFVKFQFLFKYEICSDCKLFKFDFCSNMKYVQI